MKKAEKPDISIRLRKHAPFMWEASLYIGIHDGKAKQIHYYGYTPEEVQQQLDDAYELLGPERVALIRRKTK